ncbi:Integrator complex subunit 6-A [Frankliniella fusca]|uniref:Integrator complex subunit 6-A n=1 Tax=Frankliniella fusca TaxID=407009 RepID=A0AAE1I053_9NEOP|nr:Integrator complex subunit 6-A [Frankliniella fusca]
MTIIVFLIDTSASMSQRAFLGGRPTLLDVAKGAVETFVKVRQRIPESRGDRYMLLTFEDPPNHIKAGWKENLGTFMNELKNIQCVGLTSMGAALKNAFDVLNINRMQTGIDTYGQGRCPFFLEPSVIVVITDGGKLFCTTGVQEDFTLPMHSPIPGSELTREPFRWDQRLFSLVLRLAGTPAMDRDSGLVPTDDSPIETMCEVTGGRSYSITSQRMLMQCVDSLVLKVQSGVVVNFEKIGPDPVPLPGEGMNRPEDGDEDGEGNPSNNDVNEITRNNLSAGTAWHNCRKLIYVPRNAQKGFNLGFWPIPESFWPDATANSLPPRSAHPNIKFACAPQEPMVIENLPFDKYELEPSPLTQYILARKQPTVCWQVFVPNSSKITDVGHPFGYLKASTNLSCVNLFVMPYNYPVLLPLLDDLFKVHRSKPTAEWRATFQNYVRTMPPYYCGPLRRALIRMGAAPTLPTALLPEPMDSFLSYACLNYLKRLKSTAKMEYEKLCSEVSNKAASNVNRLSMGSSNNAASEGIRVVPRSPLKKDLISHPLLYDKFNNLKDQLSEFGGFQAGIERSSGIRGVQSYRNAFDIPRRTLIDQVVRMRANFLQPTLAHTKIMDEDLKHSMPVSQMGNYQEYLKRQQPQLREIESVPVRQHMFGNPFKIDKSMMVDEADIDFGGGGGGGGGGGSGHQRANKRNVARNAGQMNELNRAPPNKRKPGPIPKDLVVQRPRSPMPGSPSPVVPLSSPYLSPPPSPAPVFEAPLPVPIVGDVPNADAQQPGLPNGPAGEDTEDIDGYGPSPPEVMVVGELASPAVILNNLPQQPQEGLILCNGDVVPDASVQPVHINNNIVSREQARRELAEIRKHNLEVRAKVYKEVRRPGKNFGPLLELLQTLKGGVEVRVPVLQEIIEESIRFKRRALVSVLQQYLCDIDDSNSNASAVLSPLSNNLSNHNNNGGAN